MDFAGQVAVVTGGSRGIGAAVCRALGVRGARVAIDYRADVAAAQAVAAELESAGGEAMVIQADVSKQSEVQAMFERVVERWGTVHILVNNAGIAVPVKLDDITVEQWDRTMAVNVRGPFLCTQAVVPYMRGQGYGCIVNIASRAGTRAPGIVSPAYSASKAGLIGLTKYLSQALLPDGIRVNCVGPGATRTDIHEVLLRADERVALMGSMEPDEVAAIAVWLCSKGAARVHGECIYATLNS